MRAILSILGWFLSFQLVLCSVLIVYDPTNSDIQSEAIASLFESVDQEVTSVAVKQAPSLMELGEKKYDNVVIVPGSTKGLGRNLTSSLMLNFLRDGGNIVALTTPQYSPTSLRELGAQLGINISPRGSSLFDHFSDSDNSLQLSEDLFDAPEVLSYLNDSTASLSNSASAFIQSSKNELSFPLIHSRTTSYVCNPELEDESPGLKKPFSVGKRSLVAAASQGRNDARFVWVGHPSLLTGEYGKNLLAWAFHERDTLRIKSVTHKDPRTGETHHIYRINDPMEYCIDIEERVGSAWKPYFANDLQLEFTMLDPYYRLNLIPSESVPGRYCQTFKLPDRYGMFMFSFTYTRKGKTYLSDKRVVTIRHNANDEWPRSWSITNSWVYMASIGSVIFAWLTFVALYLGSPPITTVSKSKTE